MTTVRIAVFAMLWCLGAAASRPIEVRDVVVAMVDDRVITRDEVCVRARALESEKERSSSAPVPDGLFRAALDRLVREALLVAEAKRLMAAQEGWSKRLDELVQREQERLRTLAGGDRAFRDRIERLGGRPDDFPVALREYLMQRMVLDAFVNSDLSVSPDELRERYRREIERFRVPERVQCRHIFVSARTAGDRKRAYETATYLMELLRKGHDFGRLAQQYSDDPHAAEGGLWDFMARGNWPAEVDAVLFSLPVGEFAGPIEREAGFSIVKVEARQQARIAPFEEVQEQIRTEMLDERRREREEKLFERLSREHYVEIFEQVTASASQGPDEVTSQDEEKEQRGEAHPEQRNDAYEFPE